MRIMISVLAGIVMLPGCSDRHSEDAVMFERICRNTWSSLENTDTHVFFGSDDWLFFGPELHHIGVGKFWGPEAEEAARLASPGHADPLPAIIDFKDQLDALDIDLIVVPVPPKAMVYSDKLTPEIRIADNPYRRFDPYHQEFYAILQGEGITVVDLLPIFLADRQNGNGPLYCRDDTHWSGRACVIAGEAIAGKIRHFSGPHGSRPVDPVHEWKRIEIHGDLARAADAGSRKESLDVRFVGRKGPGMPPPIEPDRSSPVVLLGDSHNLVFHAGGDMHARGAGLVDQLAFELGMAVDLVAVRGSGATPARINLMRRARSSPDYITRKKVIIWCFAARELTESDGWQKVPILP